MKQQLDTVSYLEEQKISAGLHLEIKKTEFLALRRNQIMRHWIGLRKIMMRWIGLRKIMMRWITLRQKWIQISKYSKLTQTPEKNIHNMIMTFCNSGQARLPIYVLLLSGNNCQMYSSIGISFNQLNMKINSDFWQT